MLSFHVKFVQTDRWTDRQTMVKQYTPDLSIRGHKNHSWKTWILLGKTMRIIFNVKKEFFPLFHNTTLEWILIFFFFRKPSNVIEVELIM